MSMNASSLTKALDLAEKVRRVDLCPTQAKWLTTGTADDLLALRANTRYAVDEIADGVTAIGYLLATNDKSQGIPDQALERLGWFLCGMGDLIVRMNDIRCMADGSAPVEETGFAVPESGRNDG